MLKKVIIISSGIILFLTAGLFASVIIPMIQEKNQNENNISYENNNISEISDVNIKEWYVYVTGAVRKPGVYKISQDSRIFHAIEAAGGFNDLADESSLNLAESLNDGAHIHVYKKSERKSEQYSITPTPAPGVYIPAYTTNKIVMTGNNKNQTKNNKNNNFSMVDVNHASVEELEKLRGVGPVIAQRIFEYRQTHGAFKKVEDLINVRGIGTAKLNAMRDQVIIR